MEDHRRGWIYAAGGMFIVSTDSFFIRWSRADAWDVVFLVAVVSLVLYIALGISHEKINPVRAWRRHPAPLTVVAVLAALSQITFVTAVTRTSVSNVVVIVAASPVMAALIGRIFLGERTTRRVWTAIAITFSGVTVIVAGSIGEPNLDGDLLAIVAIIAFSANMNIWRRWPDMSRIVGLSISACMVIAVAALFATPFSLDSRAYLACLGMGLLNPLGRLLHTHAPRFAPAAEVALFTPVETVAATLWAWLAFSEAPPTLTVVGAAIVIAGFLYGTIGRTRTPMVS